MNQVQYESKVERVAFQPRSTGSAVPALAEELNRQQQAFRQNMNYDLANFARYNQTAAANEQLASNFRASDLKSLAGLSQTISKGIVEETERNNQRQMEEGLMQAYLDGVSPEDGLAFDIAEGYLKDTDDQIQAVGDRAQATGAPFMGVQKLRELSGWKQYGYAMGVAQNAQAGYAAAMDQALAEMPGDLSSAEKAVYLSNERAKFFNETGLMGLNPALLNKYAFPGMREVDSAYLNAWRKQDEDAVKEEIIGEAQQILVASPVENFGKAIDTLTRTGITRGAARAQALKWLEDADEIDEVGAQLSWDGKLTWAEKYPAEFREARREAVKREVGNYEISQAELQLEGKGWYEQVSELWEKEPPSNEELTAAERYMQDNFNGWVDPRLDKWKARTTDAEAAAYFNQEFDSLSRAGMLTEAALNNPQVPKSVRDRYINDARMQDKARTDAPEFKAHMSQIEKDVKRAAGIQGLEPGGPGVELAVSQAQAKFQTDMMGAIQSGTMSASQAANNAYGLFKQELESSKDNPDGTYYYDVKNDGGFVNVIPKGGTRDWKEQLSNVNQALRTQGSAALDTEGLIPAMTIDDAIKNINSPNYQYPPIATYISNQLGGAVSPWEVLNRQAIKRGYGELPVNPRLQQITQGMRPEFVRMLHYKPSYSSVSRAYASTGSFDPTRVPKGYGNVILEAASANGIDPAILAGLIEVESNFNPKARSGAGAVGIAQIMPGYHPTVDPTQPIESIHYAAKYLRQLTDQLGDPMEAIYAYNGGPGGIRKSAENRAYQPKVLRAAAKYGHNPTGNPWTNPALLNPRLAYITGNIGPTSTGPHLDVKEEGGGNFAPNALDRYVVVDDPQKGRVPLSKVRVTAGQANHRRRGSHGVDYGTHSGTKVYLRGGARVVGRQKTVHGDKLTIQLPNGKRYTFLHGRSA